MQSKLIETNGDAVTFFSESETDTKLISAALRIMADIENKAELAKQRLNDHFIWVWSRQHHIWSAVVDFKYQIPIRIGSPLGNSLMLYVSDADDPRMPTEDIDAVGFFNLGEYSFKMAVETYRLRRAMSAMIKLQRYFRDRVYSEVGISADRLGSIEGQIKYSDPGPDAYDGKRVDNFEDEYPLYATAFDPYIAPDSADKGEKIDKYFRDHPEQWPDAKGYPGGEPK